MQSDLAARFQRFAERAGTSPLYQQLAFRIAEDPVVLRMASEARSVPATTLFMAAIQSLLLEGADHSLRLFYPNLTPEPRPSADAYPHFRSFCQEHEARIVEILETRRTQTNEVRRCSYLALGLAVVARRALRFSLIDAGASAGLHLLWRRFGYCYDGERFGDESSPVQIPCAMRGRGRPPFPDAWPEPLEQVGIDLHPLNACDPQHRIWLKALIWPENKERSELLDRALSIASLYPPRVFAGDVFGLLPELIERMPDNTPVCVCHSHVMNQFSEADRSRFDTLLMRLASGRDIYRLAAEWLGTQTTEFTLSRYRDGGKTHGVLALVDDHGAWIRWTDEI